MGLITTFCPPMTTGAEEQVLQTAGETRFVVDCRVKPLALVGHVKMTLAPEGMIVSCGGGNEILNTGVGSSTMTKALQELEAP